MGPKRKGQSSFNKKKSKPSVTVKCQNVISMLKKHNSNIARDIKTNFNDGILHGCDYIDLTTSPVKCSVIKSNTVTSIINKTESHLSDIASSGDFSVDYPDIDKARRKLAFNDSGVSGMSGTTSTALQSSQLSRVNDQNDANIASTSTSSSCASKNIHNLFSLNEKYLTLSVERCNHKHKQLGGCNIEVDEMNMETSLVSNGSPHSCYRGDTINDLMEQKNDNHESHCSQKILIKSASCSKLRSIVHTPKPSIRKDLHKFAPGNSETTPKRFKKSRSFNLSSVKESSYYYSSLFSRRHGVPYYLESFRKILDEVTSNLNYASLFNKDDNKYISSFHLLKDTAQMMYVRLFSRKLIWHPISKLKYSEIADDLQPSLESLVEAGLLTKDAELDDLEEVLDLLSVPDLKVLCRTYKIQWNNCKRQDMINNLKRQSRQSTISSFFSKKGENTSNVMIQRARDLVGTCYRLVYEARSLFMRLFSLFSLFTTMSDDNDAKTGQTELYRMLLTEIGTLKYPQYQISKLTQVFRSREDLIQYERAIQYESDMIAHVDNKSLDAARSLNEEVTTELEKLSQDPTTHKWFTSLPTHLRRYTTGSILTHVRDIGVDVLQRLKLYRCAVDQLNSLIQGDYCIDYHGRWYERIVLNLDQHLKSPSEALQSIEAGLRDDNVRVGHRHALFTRAVKICSTKSKFGHMRDRFQHVSVSTAPEVKVEGKLLPKSLPGSKHIFIMEDVNGEAGSIVQCGVEILVMCHYRSNGYTHGLHGEGSVVTTLFGLFFWDVMFMTVPDVFHSLYQTCPLDMYTDHFYSARRQTVDRRLHNISCSTYEELENMASQIWHSHHNIRCLGLNWKLFDDLKHVCGLIRCLGGRLLAGILGRYAKQPRQTRAGFPDLTLWNPTNQTIKFSEVKGPGDHLSNKQILWLSHLLQLGADAEVTRVIGVGTKTLRHGNQ